MSYKSLKFKIAGVSPLLMHNGQLANPLNEFAQAIKKVSGKRAKTDADHAEMARLEWYGGLYLGDGVPCIPGEVVEATIISAARKSKRGKQAQSGISCPGNFKLVYSGPTALEDLWNDPKFRLSVCVRVGNARIVRTRPIFSEWSSEIEVMFDDQVLNEREVRDTLKVAGDSVGLMEWRPKFGRFEVID